MARENSQAYDFGPFTLIPAEKRLLRDGLPVALTPKAFDLLVVLVQDADHLLEKSELMNLVWPDSFVEESNLSVKVSELRRALGDGANETALIETVPRRGYRFIGEVRVRPAEEPQVEPTGDDHAHISDSDIDLPRRRLIWPIVAAIAGVLAIVAFVGMNGGGLRDRLFPTGEVTPISSLAVLPLENLSGDNAQDYFADGMTEALITDLAKTSGIRVISRASVMQYKNAGRPLRDIARELNVEALLTGSVVRSGDRVRVSVLLVHAATDKNLWADSYERDLRDVLDLQSAVTRDVVGRIRTKLSPADQIRVTGHPTVNPEAYDHFLRGKFHLHRQTQSDNDAAIAALESASAADPTFAAAQAELAQAYVWKLFLFDPGDERKWSEKAFVASEKAIAMDPNLAVAYLARGRLLWTPANQFPHDRVIKEYRKALSLDPNLDEARNQLALVYNHIGAFDEAAAELQTALATNPGNTLARFRIGETLLFQGRYEEALNSLRSVPNQTNPALVGHQIVWALFNLGRKEEALATVRQFIADHPDENRALLESIEAVIAASDGRNDEAERHIQTALTGGKGFGHFHHTTYHIAVAYSYMGRTADAVRWLETTAETGFPCYPLFEHDKNLEKIRNEPAFVDFLLKMKPKWDVYRAVVSS